MYSAIRRGIAVLAIGALGWSPAGAAFAQTPPGPAPGQPAPGSPLAWLRSAVTAPRRVTYEGTKTVTVWGSRVQASQVRVYHQAPDRTRLEYLATSDQPLRIVIVNGPNQAAYIPARNQVIEGPVPRPGEDLPGQRILPQIARNYTIRFDGEEEVAGRRARVIAVDPRFPNRPRLRVWVDVQTRLILRYERYGPAGALREEAAFISVRINPPLAADLFTPSFPPGAQVVTRSPAPPLTIEAISARVGFIPQLPSYLPPGYAFVRSRVFSIKGVPTAAFAFTDGVATLTLFERRGAQAGPPNARPVRVGGAPGAVAARGVANVLHWNARGISFTLVGDLPAAEMVRIGASVPPVGTSLGRPGPAGAWTGRAAAALAALLAPSAAEAAVLPPAEAGGARAAGAPPVPISPYITNDTHVIGPGIPWEEKTIWRALAARGLAPIVVKVTVASDGVTKLPDGRLARLAWIWFVYGMRWTGGAGAAVREVRGSAQALAEAALGADPRVTRVLLTGYFHRSGPFDGRRMDATFTAELFRSRLAAAPAVWPPGTRLARGGHVWYAPSLLGGALAEHPSEAHDPHFPPGIRAPRPLLPGGRSAESVETFHGGLWANVVELRDRLAGLLFGVEIRGRLWRGTPLRREVALTFDDGPNPVATPLLLAILRRYGAHATFLVIGEHARAYPYLVAEMAADGDEVGDHTYHHPNLATLAAPVVAREIGAAAAVIGREAGRPPRWFRPPGGDYTETVVRVARARGMGLAMWTANSGDWALPPANTVVRRVLARAEPGAILLMHNGTLNTVRALPDIIVELRRRGYAFVTLSQLARDAE